MLCRRLSWVVPTSLALACGGALTPLPSYPPPQLAPRPLAHPWSAGRSEDAIRIRLKGRGFLATHDHELVARAWAGRADFDPERPEATTVEVDVLTASLHDVTPKLSESSRREVDEGALGEDGLDAAKYPHVRLVTTRLEIDGPPRGDRAIRGTLVGHLELHGQTRPVRSALVLRPEGERYRATGTVRLRQSDFGITPTSKLFGALAVDDEVVVEYAIVCSRVATDRSASGDGARDARERPASATPPLEAPDGGVSEGDGG